MYDQAYMCICPNWCVTSAQWDKVPKINSNELKLIIHDKRILTYRQYDLRRKKYMEQDSWDHLET